MNRRDLLLGAPAALGVPTLAAPALSQSGAGGRYPNRPIRMIIPYPPGGATDAMSRLVAFIADLLRDNVYWDCK